MKPFLFITLLILFVITICYGQNTANSTAYILPEEFIKPQKWKEVENKNPIYDKFYCKEDSLSIKNYNEAFIIIDTAKDFCLLYSVYKWCKDNYEVAFPQLVKRLTDTTIVGLYPFIDLHIQDRQEYSFKNPVSTGCKPGIHINEDIFTIAGRVSWILNGITGENFAVVRASTTIIELNQLKQNWITWIKKLE